MNYPLHFPVSSKVAILTLWIPPNTLNVAASVSRVVANDRFPTNNFICLVRLQTRFHRSERASRLSQLSEKEQYLTNDQCREGLNLNFYFLFVIQFTKEFQIHFKNRLHSSDPCTEITRLRNDATRRNCPFTGEFVELRDSCNSVKFYFSLFPFLR